MKKSTTQSESAWPGEPTAAHPLAPLLMPRSIALIGASATPGSMGHGMIGAASRPGTPSRLHLVNPRYREIEGRPCYPSLADLPEPVDLAVIALANAHLESALGAAIAAGAKAAAIFASGYLPQDRDPPLTARLAAMAREAGLAICGGNCMGFYHLDFGLRICGFSPPDWMRAGNIAFITHSGSAFAALCHNDKTLDFSLAVSAGQELATDCAAYMDFALSRPATRAIGLFLETVRRPEAFRAALDRAADSGVPVIALKVGRHEASAAMAVSHSGAIAGNHAAYRALFDHHNVVAVDNMDDLVNALRFYAGGRDLGPGGIATMHDSGGFRELAMDLAIEADLPFAQIAPATRDLLAARLDPGLEPANPLDAWGTGQDWQGIFADCFAALIADPDTALGAFCVETRDGYDLSEGYADILLRAREKTVKPLILATNVASNGSDSIALRLSRGGVPVLSGLASAFRVLRLAMTRRDRLAAPADPAPALDPAKAEARAPWRRRLRIGEILDEAESLALLADYDLPVIPHLRAAIAAEVAAAGARLGFPVALKTARPGAFHKSDLGGVVLGLKDAAALAAAYADLSRRLGPECLVAAMAPAGIDLAFGLIADPQFGPIVMIGAGGTLIEFLPDRVFLLPPFGPTEARSAIDRLALRPLLDGKRGQAPADLDALALAAARFSRLAADLGGDIAEIDINPLRVGRDGALALDALIVPRKD